MSWGHFYCILIFLIFIHFIDAMTKTMITTFEYLKKRDPMTHKNAENFTQPLDFKLCFDQ